MTAAVTFVVLSLPWIVILSQKVGHWTIGESARLNEGIETVRIDVTRTRREDGINLQRNEQVEVLFEIPRIAREILTRTELRRIDKDRDHDHVALTPGAPHQAQVALVQRAHGGDERERLPLDAHLAREIFHFTNCSD